MNPPPTPEPEAEREGLKDLLARRERLMADRAREWNRLERENSTRATDSPARNLDWLNREIEQLTREYQEPQASNPELAQQAQR